MKITLSDGDGERLVNASVPDNDWAAGAIDAAWAYLRHTGAESITARSNDPLATGDENWQKHYVRICTVSLEIHDE